MIIENRIENKMKSPFNKLRGLGLGLGLGLKKKKKTTHLPLDDQLSKASQDMQDMKDCYDTLLSSAAATANSAYEFSESLQEMGDCLLQKTSLNDDDHQDTGRVLLMLGKVQFQIQKLVDNYRAHISRTLTVPSESLLNELHIVEDMKRQCDDKRMSYDEMKTRRKNWTRLGTNKGDYVSSHLVRAAKEEFEEDATLFIFRMKSLKGSQSRSLLTQAARHHAAQMCFFRKALKSLETIEPHVQLVTQQHHIDYQFSGLEDDDDRDSVFLTDDEDDGDESDNDTENGELSFNYQRNEPKNIVSSSENSTELDSADLTFPQVAQGNSAKANMQQQQQKKPLWNSSTFNIAVNAGSKSAPLYAVSSNIDPSEKFRQMRQSSARKLNTYVLPTPLDKTQRYHTQQAPSTTNKNINNSNNNNNNNMWYSSPLESKRHEKEKFSGPIPSKNNGSKPTPLPSPPKHVIDRLSPVSAKKVKRYAFSGPLAGIARSNNSFFSASGPIRTSSHTPQFSGSLLGTPLSSTRLSSFAGSFVSSPKISELHELPRPPPNLTSKIPPSNSGFSAPLMTSKDFCITRELPASTFPVPPESQNFKAAVSPPQTPVSKGNTSSNLR